MTESDSPEYDVIICGAGPAGRALAGACARQGLRTLCVAPDVDDAWENNFGVWVDELEAAGLSNIYDRQWSRSIVTFDEGHTLELPRAYGRVDAGLLRAVLERDAGAHLQYRASGVRSVTHEPRGSILNLDDGSSLRTRLVVDATGFGGCLLDTAGQKGDAWQVAYGVMARVPKHPFPLDAMWFMDWRDSFLPDRSGPPTFLYAMPFGPQQVFLEETSLVARPGVDMGLLEERLALRARSLGLEVQEVEWTERCYIPMNPPLPDRRQRVLGFGAAAGLVHPGSGYSVSLSLSLAEPVAAAIAAGLGEGLALDAVAKAVWREVWSPGRLRMRRAHLLGMEIFARSSAAGLRRYLGLFWKAPERFWHGYLSASRTPTELAGAFISG